MRRSWIANIIAALNQDCVVQASNASGAEDDIDLELGLCTLTAAYGCAVGAAEFVAVLMLLSLFPADRTAEGLIAHLVMLVVGIWFLSGLELIPAAIEVMGPFFLVLTYIWQRYETRAREGARHIRFHIR